MPGRIQKIDFLNFVFLAEIDRLIQFAPGRFFAGETYIIWNGWGTLILFFRFYSISF
jgi:hypothetical protein